jgi:hypothetical protein
MLKRNIAILIAGGLLSAQAGLAVAENAGAWNMLPSQAKYFAEREAANPNPTGAKAPVFPIPSAGAQFTLLPALNKYLAERAARNPNPTGYPGGVFSDECLKNAPGG